MYAGEIREFADVDDIFHSPADSYTKELLASTAQWSREG